MLAGYRYNVLCSETLNKKWTKTAIECYELGCVCANCTLYKFFFYPQKIKCRMKETVIELVRQLGIPKVSKNDI